MNEQRQQAYFDLIQSLLNCPSGEEPEILAANQDLLDAGFLQAVEAAAQMFSQQGDENTANWLQGLASYLRKTLNQDNEVDLQSLSEEEIQAYFQFLTEVLQATKSSVGDAQVVYPLLAKHTDKLNGVFAEILRCWGTNTLGEVQADEAEYLAAVIVAFSSLIQQFPDEKASSIEIAITGYEIALTVYTCNANPQGWAMVKNNLGTSYNDRILGDRAENLEKALEAYTAALEVRSREAFPQEHAETLFNLGLLYQDANQFTLACSSYASAIATIESLREEIISGEENKRKQAEYFNRVYSFMVEVCLKLGNVTEAIEYVERSKNRNLVEPAQSR
jgi:tetratricopeptide (TPR) repeat protein